MRVLKAVQLTLHSLHQKQPKLNRQLRLFIQTESLVCHFTFGEDVLTACRVCNFFGLITYNSNELISYRLYNDRKENQVRLKK